MKIDRVHFYTRNAAKTKDWFIRNIDFKAIADRTDRDTHTEVVALNSACLQFSSPLTNSNSVAKYLDAHPSGVADVAFRVKDVRSIVDRAYKLGLKILQPLQTCYSSSSKFNNRRTASDRRTANFSRSRSHFAAIFIDANFYPTYF